MGYQPYPIYPFVTGLDIDDEPFLLPKDAFIEIDNAHIQHGRVEKRSGYTTLGSVSGGSPIMGIYKYYDNTNAVTTLAFNQTRAATLDATTLPYTWTLLDLGAIMSGGDNDFIWAVNWQPQDQDNRLYFTNGLPLAGGLNGIRYYDAVASTTTTTSIGTPTLGGTRTLEGAKLLFTLKQRLVLLYVYENNGVSSVTYPQRARWCQAQDPSTWDDTIPGGGGYVDAPTGEHIISARPLQNSLVVFFSNSVWLLEPTSDPALTFRWKKINDFRGCDGKMASATYDRYVVSAGRRGIFATDGLETRRVDDKIQEFVSNRIHLDEFEKVFMLRNFVEKRMWMLYPSNEESYSNKSLIYEDETSSWSTYTIGMNSLGYGQNGYDWKYSDFTVANGRDWYYSEAGEDQYNSYYYQGDSELFLGGDTTGNIWLLNDGANDNGASITAAWETGKWNPYMDEGVECQLGYVDFFVDSHPTTYVTVQFFKDNDEDAYQVETFDCIPDLGFINPLTNITQANPGVVTSSDHGLSNGDVVYIYGVQGMIEVNTGPYTVTVIDDDSFSIGVDTSAYTAYTDGGQIFQREFYRTKTWKRVYGGGIGYLHNIACETDGDADPFVLHQMRPWFRKIGRRTLG